jgi:S-formylglutathione hydrolase FrmB
MRVPGLLVLFAALALSQTPASGETQASSFRSPSLGKEVRYVVDLPPSAGKGQKLPVVYALHGLFEGPEFWDRRGLGAIAASLWQRGEVPEFIVVAVDGGDSFFVNGPEGAYEDLVTKDLIARVESTLPVLPGRSGRALLGVSMGGYAALRIAFTQPDLYAAVATHSAMLLESIPKREDGAGRWQMTAFHSAFGDPIDASLWKASDPLELARVADPGRVPPLYFDCGSEDRYGLFRGNSDLDRTLGARGVPHTFGLYPGDHGYEYVRSVLEKSLRFIGRALSNGTPPKPGP